MLRLRNEINLVQSVQWLYCTCIVVPLLHTQFYSRIVVPLLHTQFYSPMSCFLLALHNF
jgi:hypothetical protein